MLQAAQVGSCQKLMRVSGPLSADMPEVELAFVVPTSAILDGFKQPGWTNHVEEDNSQGGTPIPSSAAKGWAKLKKHMNNKKPAAPPQLTHGRGLDFKQAEPTPFKFPLRGAQGAC